MSDVGFFEDDVLPGPLPARLFAGLLRPANDDAFSEGIESADQDFPEAAAVSDKQSHRRNSPNNAEHSEQATRVVALEGDPGFANDFNHHR